MTYLTVFMVAEQLELQLSAEAADPKVIQSAHVSSCMLIMRHL